jgi:hypothetical protein
LQLFKVFPAVVTTVLFVVVLASDAWAAPYLKIQGESMTASTATTVDTTADGFTYTTFQGDGDIYSWAPVKNAGWLRIRARSNGCGDGTFARLSIIVGRAGKVFDQELSGGWGWYTTPGFVVDQSGTGSANVIVAATQTDGRGTCTRQVRLDVIEFYVWRAFSPTSPWNKKADEIAAPPGTKTGIQSGTGAWLSAGQSGLVLGGCPPGSGCMQDRPFSKPICFGESDQPTATSATGPAQSLVKGNLAYSGQVIPLASPCAAASGSDGHLAVTNVPRTFSYEWWRCVVAATPCGPSVGYGVGTDGVVARWSLLGDGVANAQDGAAPTCCPNRSARGSGTPLVSTVIRGEEAVNGIEHAIGCTITDGGGTSDVSSRYLHPPATQTDGLLASGGSRYGELYTLRSDFLTDNPTNPTRGRPWSRGELNIIDALMTYGCYLVDRHGGFEIDTDSSTWTQADWTAADVMKTSLSRIQPSDMRYRAIAGQAEY